MAVSSNTLFHFTPNFDTLIKILKSRGFWPRYCKETRTIDGKIIEYYVPISCFCDIPLSLIGYHVKQYGGYGIGMSKDWALKNKRICPVFYTHDYSKSLMTDLFRDSIIKEYGYMYGVDDFVRAQSLLKPYMDNGELYYNEREWRYIPDTKLKDSYIRNPKNVEELHNITKDKLAHFESSDIKYIIIKSERQRTRILSKIRMIFKELADVNLNLLQSKVITLQQIKEDF